MPALVLGCVCVFMICGGEQNAGPWTGMIRCVDTFKAPNPTPPRRTGRVER